MITFPISDHVRGELKTATEKEKTDRLRERRKKKRAQRIRHKEREKAEKAVDKANPGLGNKHAKLRALRQLEQAEKEGTVTLVLSSIYHLIVALLSFKLNLQLSTVTRLFYVLLFLFIFLQDQG